MLHYVPSRLENSKTTFEVTKSLMSYYDLTIGFLHKGYTIFNTEMTLEEARELANKILAMCESEPITPIGDFQDSTPNSTL